MIFSTNNTLATNESVEEYNVQPAEGYNGLTDGFDKILAETVVNDYLLFSTILENDMSEIYLKGIIESSNNEEVLTEAKEKYELVIEASLGGAVANIKAFLMKQWGKIKGAITSAIAKLSNAMIRDGQKYYESTKKAFDGVDKSTLKLPGFVDVDTNKLTALSKFNNTSLGSVDLFSLVSSTDADKVTAAVEKVTKEEYAVSLAKEITGVSEGDSVKAVMAKKSETCFAEPKDATGSDVFDKVVTILKNGKATIVAVKEEQKSVDKTFKMALDSVKKLENAVNKIVKSKKDDKTTNVGGTEVNSGNAAAVQKILHGVTVASSKESAVVTQHAAMVISTTAKAYKLSLASYKKMLAGVKKPAKGTKEDEKSTNEDAVLFDAIDEAVDYEFEVMAEEE